MLIQVMQVFIMLMFLNSFNPELQLKDTESAVRNKLIDLQTDFKFVAILAIEF